MSSDNDLREQCRSIATEAQCIRRSVGALLAQSGEIVGWGANRSADPALNCLAGDCPRGMLSYEQLVSYSPYNNCIAKHAEIAALEMAGYLARGTTLYVTALPCSECSAALLEAGVLRWIKVYPLATLAATLAGDGRIASPEPDVG